MTMDELICYINVMGDMEILKIIWEDDDDSEYAG